MVPKFRINACSFIWKSEILKLPYCRIFPVMLKGPGQFLKLLLIVAIQGRSEGHNKLGSVLI